MRDHWVKAKGLHKQALEEYRAVLGIQRRLPVLGAEHPSTLATRVSIARVYQSKGLHKHALEEYRTVLGIQQRLENGFLT